MNVTFPHQLLAFLVYGALVASAAGGVLLLVLLALDFKHERTW